MNFLRKINSFQETIPTGYEPSTLNQEIINGTKILDIRATELFRLLEQAKQNNDKDSVDKYSARLAIMSGLEEGSFVPLTPDVDDSAINSAIEQIRSSFSKLESIGRLHPGAYSELKEEGRMFYDKLTRRVGDSVRAKATLALLQKELLRRQGFIPEQAANQSHFDIPNHLSEEGVEKSKKYEEFSTEKLLEEVDKVRGGDVDELLLAISGHLHNTTNQEEREALKKALENLLDKQIIDFGNRGGEYCA